MKKFHFFLMLFLQSMTPLGYANDVPSIGGFANEMMGPVSMLSDFIGTASIIVGISCLFASFLRFMQYRVNPLASPISTVVVLIILGIATLLLPFLYKLLGYGVPFLGTK